ncbi:F-box protein At1g47056-like [Hibiscus syriacus]|uniref:F-box protein At1g47056-like n=1 Tax=Hibiscus syriacus TaxID=106335 RepID=UPI001920DD3A|nr:F-box protein At1g47056-like [Hibiscus syriacus]
MRPSFPLAFVVVVFSPMQSQEAEKLDRSSMDGLSDFISVLPDECLACIFQFLSPYDRKHCSLICRRWLRTEGQSRHRLSLNAQSDLQHLIPSIFSRFDTVTKLALKCDRISISIGDEALVLISERYRNLTRLKLRTCRDLTDAGISAFSKNCRGLKKLSCRSFTFVAKGMNAVLDHCPANSVGFLEKFFGCPAGTNPHWLDTACGGGLRWVIIHVGCYNEYGQLGRGVISEGLQGARVINTCAKFLDEAPELVKITQVSCGEYHTAAIYA